MIKDQKYPAEPLTVEEVEAVIKATGRGPCGARNRAIIAVLYRTGMRVSEALALTISDFNWTNNSIRVRCGKGGKARVVGFDDSLNVYLKAWLIMRRDTLGFDDNVPLFCTLKGGPVSKHYVGNMFRDLRKRAGIGKRVHAHGLRHTHAYELVEEGTRLDVIQRQLGHSNVATTHTYVNHINPAEVVNTISSREWKKK